MSGTRNKKSYRRRLMDDLKLCEAAGGMDDVVEIINQKLKDLKEYQRNYQKEWYKKNKKSVSGNVK